MRERQQVRAAGRPEPRVFPEPFAGQVERFPGDALRQQSRQQFPSQSIGKTADYTRITAILADAFPFSPLLQFEAGAAMIEAGRAPDGWRYAERALELEPRNVNNLLMGAHASILSGRREQGKALLQRALAQEPGNETASQVLRELAQQ